MTLFARCLAVLLPLEGGYVDDPRDPGGKTNFGVTQRVYTAWRLAEQLPDRSVQGISTGEVQAIYFGDYWRAVGCDGLSDGMALCAFDASVNCGVGTAKQFLLDVGRADIDAYCDRRLRYYDSLVLLHPAMTAFLHGWHNRVALIRATALGWADSPPPPLAA